MTTEATLADRDNSLATAFGLKLETPPEIMEAETFLGLDLPQANGNENWDLLLANASPLRASKHRRDPVRIGASRSQNAKRARRMSSVSLGMTLKKKGG